MFAIISYKSPYILFNIRCDLEISSKNITWLKVIDKRLVKDTVVRLFLTSSMYGFSILFTFMQIWYTLADLEAIFAKTELNTSLQII